MTNIGIWLDLRNPPDRRQDWASLYAQTLELCEEADHLGAHSVWLSEHHLFDDGYLSQPLAFAAAVAARTKRVRIGTAITVAPLRPAALLAEESTLVDVLSNGRLELGLGTGYRLPEFSLYGADPSHKYDVTDERARQIRSLWSDPALLPHPVQERPAIWLGYQGPNGATRAGRLGESLLTANRDSVEPYLNALSGAGHDVSRARMTGGVNAWITQDPEADWPEISQRLSYHWDSYHRHGVEGTGANPPRPIDPERYRARGFGSAMNQFLLATPTDAAAEMRSFVADTPIETLLIFVSMAGTSYELTQRHLRTLVCDLAPRLKGGGQE